MKFAKLKIDDTTDLSLAYDFNDIADAEQLVGCNLLSGMGGNPTAVQLRGLIYAMTRVSHPKMELGQIGNLLRFDVAARAIRAIGEACAMSVSDEYAEEFRKAMQEEEEGPTAKAAD